MCDASSSFSGFVAPAFRAVLGRAGQRRRTGPAATFPMKSYPLRVGDRGRLALAPERPHLGPFVQMGVSDDRARGLDELPMPEHRSEEHTSELQSLMRNSNAVFCLKKKKTTQH